MSQPASLRRALMEVFEVRSLRKRFRAMCRTIARFSAECPALTRLSSSRKDRSSTQWTLFSMPQWLRVAWSSLLASESRLENVVAGFQRFPLSYPSLRLHHPDAPQPRPGQPGFQPGQLLRVVYGPATAGFDASVALVHGLKEVVVHALVPSSAPTGKQGLSHPPAAFLDFP